MPDAARRIELLRLTAGAEEGLARGRILVEDAFRIASFPAETERRLLVIRKLDLGIVDPDRSSAALAPAIESAVRDVAGRAVRFDDPAAPAADAVFFPDALAAPSALVERLAGAAPPTEWYWGAVFEGRVPRGEPEAAVRLALDRLLESPAAAVRLALLLDRLRACGTLDRFLSWLRPGDGERLLVALGVDAAPDRHRDAPSEPFEHAPDDPPEPRSLFITSALRPWRPAVAAWTVRWGESDLRSRWLAVVVLVNAQPSMLTHPQLPSLARRILRAARQPSAIASPPRTSRQGGPPSQVEPGAPPLPLPVGSVAPQTPHGLLIDRPHRSTAIDADAPASSSDGSDAPDTGGVESPKPAAAEQTWELFPTSAGGLLFVLPLLSRLRIEEVLALNPVLVEAEFPSWLLVFIADRLHVPDMDAMRAPLVPTDLARASREMALEDWDRLLGTWLTRVRRAVHRTARMGLRALVDRPGQVAATRTHIDVVLPLRGLDIRVRRAGLDVDPGWVPWLGRVVTFHYESMP